MASALTDPVEYGSEGIKDLARDTANGKGGRLVRWSIVSQSDDVYLKVYYKPRHWRHCPGCRETGFGQQHVGPKGEPVKELETATVAL